MNKRDQELADRIKVLRDDVDALVRAMLDQHMAKHYPGRRSLWLHATRASIEVATWPAWKRRRCYSQD